MDRMNNEMIPYTTLATQLNQFHPDRASKQSAKPGM
jgi:hypothetical protein